jgi:hypothetical protein
MLLRGVFPLTPVTGQSDASVSTTLQFSIFEFTSILPYNDYEADFAKQQPDGNMLNNLVHSLVS